MSIVEGLSTLNPVYQQNETQRMIAEAAKDFANREILPNVSQWDEDEHFPKELFGKLGEMGLMGMLVPEEYGGTGLGYHEYVAAIVEISKVDPSIGLSMAAHNSLCTNHILMFASEAQKKKYLPKLASGEWIGAWGLTEPNTGSDAGGMMTVAKEEGDHFIINGAKNFITHGKSGEVAVVIVRTGEKGDSHGMTAFIIERDTPGFSAGRKEKKLGMRASETTELIFENCKVHKDQVLGEVGEGFIQSMKILDGGRISIAALSIGTAEGAFEHALKYAQERKQFGKEIAKFQAIGFKLANMATEIDAAKLLTYKAADMKMKGLNMTKESAMAKYFASEMAVRACNEAVQIHGGYGFIREYPVEKYYRDVKLCTIGEGTSEIQQLVISRELLKK